MLVPSAEFLAFAAIFAAVYNINGGLWWRRSVLLVANFCFLASFSKDLVSFLPFGCFIALGFLAQRFARDGAAPRFFVATLALTLVVFFWLKRYSFIPSFAFLPFPYVLVGLSYVFFRVLHLIIDSHQGAINGRVGVISYLNYTLNFTSLTSGPIQRYQDYHVMEVERLPLDWKVAGEAVERIILGYFKVSIVSLVLSMFQKSSIADLSSSGGPFRTLEAGVMTFAVYPIYLYFNFSGYVDVVIGVARFFRISLPENFDRPFSSENFITFWSRWHITLSNWLKTYVFNPIMMASLSRITSPKVTPYIAVGAFFITFFLVGLWHGQTSEFLFFGFLQGGGVAANKLYQLRMQRWLGRKGYAALAAHPVYRAAARGVTFTWFAFSLLWFWSNWRQIGSFFTALGSANLLVVWTAIFLIATIVLAASEAVRKAIVGMSGRGKLVLRSRYLRTSWSTGVVLVMITVITLLGSPAPDIVYKSF